MTALNSTATVLVVDDDVVLARAFARALTAGGYRVRTAHCAEDALRVIHEQPPDAIILDFRMPLINGGGFLYRLREEAAHRFTPVMVITGDQMLNEETRMELRDLGAELKLKPIGLDDLLAATHQLLTARRPGAGTSRATNIR